MKVGVLGPGAIGSLLAGLLWKTGHDVVCIGRPATASAIGEQGIPVESPVFGNFRALPRAAVRLESSVDLLFITVKSPFLDRALEGIDPVRVQRGVIVSLLNGVGHSDTIRRQLGARLSIGMIGSIEVEKNRDGVVRQLSRQQPHIDLASDHDVAGPQLEQIAEIIRATGITTTILATEAEVIWRKLVRLSAIASITAAFQKPVGVIRSEPHLKKLLEDIIVEGSRVAWAEGVAIDPAEVLRQINALPPTLTTSLQRDIRAQVPSEVESITGAILRLAEVHHIPVPAYAQTYKRIMART